MSKTDDVLAAEQQAVANLRQFVNNAAPDDESPNTVECAAIVAHIDRLARELRAVKEELRGIDEVMARRPALDQPSRRDKIEHAILTAKRADAAEAEVARLQSEVARLTGFIPTCGVCDNGATLVVTGWQVHSGTPRAVRLSRCDACWEKMNQSNYVYAGRIAPRPQEVRDVQGSPIEVTDLRLIEED